MKKRLIFGLEARLFALIFLVASFISLGVAVYIYDQEKDLTEQALADELLRAAHVFAASLNPDDVAQLPYEAPNSSLVQQYRNLAQRIVDEAGVVYALPVPRLEQAVVVLASSAMIWSPEMFMRTVRRLRQRPGKRSCRVKPRCRLFSGMSTANGCPHSTHTGCRRTRGCPGRC